MHSTVTTTRQLLLAILIRNFYPPPKKAAGPKKLPKSALNTLGIHQRLERGLRKFEAPTRLS